MYNFLIKLLKATSISRTYTVEHKPDYAYFKDFDDLRITDLKKEAYIVSSETGRFLDFNESNDGIYVNNTPTRSSFKFVLDCNKVRIKYDNLCLTHIMPTDGLVLKKCSEGDRRQVFKITDNFEIFFKNSKENDNTYSKWILADTVKTTHPPSYYQEPSLVKTYIRRHGNSSIKDKRARYFPFDGKTRQPGSKYYCSCDK